MDIKYIEENIEILRKQRDENIVGGYRDFVVQTYNYIEKKIAKSATDFCNPKNMDVSNAVFGNRKQEKKIRGYIADLKKSGYLLIEGVGADREVRIIKSLDF
jgi:hypothetical protein